MYRAFNIKLSASDLNSLDKYVYKNYDEEKRNYKQKLNKLINTNKVIKAEEIKNILMPNVKADIFISHSHKDEELAKKLAGFLKDAFGLTSFIDSLYWGNIDEFLNEMNKSHYNSDKKTYDHAKSNNSCRHADMILTSALTEMVDKCECIFFLNTNNSVPLSKDILDADKDSTYSPWIYHEIYTTSIIKKHVPERARLEEKKKLVAYEQLNESINIAYNINLDNMIDLNWDKISTWNKKLNTIKGSQTLDILYELFLETNNFA